MTLQTAQQRIEHVIVLMLENRSFGHMLGFLDHPSVAYPGLVENDQRYINVDRPPNGGAAHHPTSTGRPVLPFDPHHSHGEVLKQATNADGFAASYQSRARVSGINTPMVQIPQGTYQIGGLVMACQLPANVPALATLAREFAVCTAWHSSVPGETWPNRNFVHAATSDGSVNNELGAYTDLTIFEQLETHRRLDISAGRRPWRIYHEGPAQVMAFRNLWGRDEIGNWDPINVFARHVAEGDLASYSFIEPIQNTPVANQLLPTSSSQHPGNNIVDPGQYLAPPPDAGADFVAADNLVAQIYETLRSHPGVFNKSMLVITHDEHGGLVGPGAAPTRHPTRRPRNSGLAPQHHRQSHTPTVTQVRFRPARSPGARCDCVPMDRTSQDRSNPAGSHSSAPHGPRPVCSNGPGPNQSRRHGGAVLGSSD